MKNSDILIKRTTSGWFTTEFINLLAHDTLVYRRVVDFHPSRDKRQEYAQGTAEVAAVREFIAYATGSKVDCFRAEGMMDGVAYQIYLVERQLYFFCPDYSPDPDVRTLGAKLEKLFKQFEITESHASST